MLRKIRIILAALFFILTTLLFLDFTGTVHAWFGWMAEIQFLPAVLALNVGVIVFLVLLTTLFGRVYCSVICPMGVFQDIILWFSRRKKKNRNRFKFRKENKLLRYGVLLLFIALFVAGLSSIAILIAPYSAYGRIASNLFAPVYQWGNNLLALLSEHYDSYAFYSHEVWLKSLPVFIIAVATFVVIFVMAWRGGRSWCNNICPVGTILGFFSRFSLFRPVFDLSKCNGCTICARNCKASCINPEEHKVDMSRCVVCMDCLKNCHSGAISYRPFFLTPLNRCSDKCENTPAGNVDSSRRSFVVATALVASSAALKAEQKAADGALAVLEDKKIPQRGTPLKPAGAVSLKAFSTKCTGCQLCVSVCPNQVLRPSGKLMTLMQPEISFEKGYCRPECNKCSNVCPSDAIVPVTVEEKSSIQIGHAVFLAENCVVNTDGVTCGNCARHCPAGAIRMVAKEPGSKLRIPTVNEERCIGCGSCEYHCPARPLSAIYVVGHEIHRVL